MGGKDVQMMGGGISEYWKDGMIMMGG